LLPFWKKIAPDLPDSAGRQIVNDSGIEPLEVSMPIDTRTAPYAAFILRLGLGILFLAHAGLKIFVFTPAGTAGFFGSLGLPPALGYVTIVWELVGAVALILGIWPRAAAIAVIPILAGAIATVHGPAGFFFTNPHGGWEFIALWIAALLALALTGDGAFALLPTPGAARRLATA
jgi:putative oxidoreductase